jgi:hypothetical protein
MRLYELIEVVDGQEITLKDVNLPETPRAGDSILVFNKTFEYCVIKVRFTDHSSGIELVVKKIPVLADLSDTDTLDPRGESTTELETAGWAEHLGEVTRALNVSEPFNPTKKQL